MEARGPRPPWPRESRRVVWTRAWLRAGPGAEAAEKKRKKNTIRGAVAVAGVARQPAGQGRGPGQADGDRGVQAPLLRSPTARAAASRRGACAVGGHGCLACGGVDGEIAGNRGTSRLRPLLGHVRCTEGAAESGDRDGETDVDGAAGDGWMGCSDLGWGWSGAVVKADPVSSKVLFAVLVLEVTAGVV